MSENLNISYAPYPSDNHNERLSDIDGYLNTLTERTKFCLANIYDELADLKDSIIENYHEVKINRGNAVGEFTNDSHTSERFNDYQNNTATGVFSHTEGYSNKNDGDFSHVGGKDNKLTSGTASFVSGMLNTVAGDFNGVTGNTNSVTGDNNGAEGLSNSITGDCSHAEGQSNTITSDFSHGEGFGNKASGDSSHTEGQGNTSSGFASHTEGYSNTASGSYSHAEGSTNKAEGESSHAQGFRSNATKSYSHAEGLQTNSVAEASHSEGGFTTAEGNFSHAEGMGAKATGQNSHAEGNYTTASGEGSHTEGLRTEAKGNYSHAGGEYTIVTAKSGTAIGRYNLSTDKLFVVGNGNYEQRSDALTLDEAGNLFVAGSINAGGGIEVELPISDVISDTSTNNTAAGSKAVYDYTQQNFVKVGDISDWAMQPNKPTYTASEVGAAAEEHTHTKADITDFPASLPASGGNADTVDGKHAIDFAEAEHTHSEYLPLSGGDMTGTLTLPAGLVNDATTNSPSFIIGSKTSYHVEFSNSVIQIKNGDKAEGALYLNRYGGNIGIGDEESSILFCNARVKITPDGFTTSKKLIALAGIEGNITNATNADMVDGKHAVDFAEAEHTHTIGNITDFPEWIGDTKPTYTAEEVGAAAEEHTHTKADITDFPASLPANGGNADTVDGKHASAFALASHTHNYLPLTGGTLTGVLTLSTGNDASGTAFNSPPLVIGDKNSQHL